MRKARVIVRKVRIRLTSLRLRLMLASAALAMLFMLLLMPVLQGVFLMALEETVEKRLASDAAALISAARIQEGQLHMPDKMPDEEFDNLDSHLLGFIFDREGRLIWRSRSSLDELVNYKPRYDGRGHEFVRIRDESGQEYFVYDIEVDLLRGNETALSIVTMQPTREYQGLFDGFAWQLRLWLGLALLVLLGLLWFGLTWGFRSLRGLSDEGLLLAKLASVELARFEAFDVPTIPPELLEWMLIDIQARLQTIDTQLELIQSTWELAEMLRPVVEGVLATDGYPARRLEPLLNQLEAPARTESFVQLVPWPGVSLEQLLARKGWLRVGFYASAIQGARWTAALCRRCRRQAPQTLCQALCDKGSIARVQPKVWITRVMIMPVMLIMILRMTCLHRPK